MKHKSQTIPIQGQHNKPAIDPVSCYLISGSTTYLDASWYGMQLQIIPYPEL
jgi:hypothetical protein